MNNFIKLIEILLLPGSCVTFLLALGQGIYAEKRLTSNNYHGKLLGKSALALLLLCFGATLGALAYFQSIPNFINRAKLTYLLAWPFALALLAAMFAAWPFAKLRYAADFSDNNLQAVSPNTRLKNCLKFVWWPLTSFLAGSAALFAWVDVWALLSDLVPYGSKWSDSEALINFTAVFAACVFLLCFWYFLLRNIHKLSVVQQAFLLPFFLLWQLLPLLLEIAVRAYALGKLYQSDLLFELLSNLHNHRQYFLYGSLLSTFACVFLNRKDPLLQVAAAVPFYTGVSKLSAEEAQEDGKDEILISAKQTAETELTEKAELEVKQVPVTKAMYRKALARQRQRRIWSALLSLAIIASLFILTFFQTWLNRSVELSPPEPYELEDNMALISLESLNDMHLHRYAYEAHNGNIVRFIAIQKSKGSYAVMLDACEICGASGYYERDDQVVCKLCGVMMNRGTLGFKGGCNPIPLQFSLGQGKISVDTKQLEESSSIFR